VKSGLPIVRFAAADDFQGRNETHPAGSAANEKIASNSIETGKRAPAIPAEMRRNQADLRPLNHRY
jgi:hypothetical protein